MKTHYLAFVFIVAFSITKFCAAENSNIASPTPTPQAAIPVPQTPPPIKKHLPATFASRTEPIRTSQWNNYTNSQFGFSIQYPVISEVDQPLVRSMGWYTL